MKFLLNFDNKGFAILKKEEIIEFKNKVKQSKNTITVGNIKFKNYKDFLSVISEKELSKKEVKLLKDLFNKKFGIDFLNFEEVEIINQVETKITQEKIIQLKSFLDPCLENLSLDKEDIYDYLNASIIFEYEDSEDMFIRNNLDLSILLKLIINLKDIKSMLSDFDLEKDFRMLLNIYKRYLSKESNYILIKRYDFIKFFEQKSMIDIEKNKYFIENLKK